MDVTVQAFEIETGKGIKPDEFFNHLGATSATPIQDRYLYLTRDNGILKGVLLTARNIKAFSRMIKNGTHIQLNPEALQNGELAHFNYFIINEENLHGLFQYYHGAASIHGLATVLRFRHNE